MGKVKGGVDNTGEDDDDETNDNEAEGDGKGEGAGKPCRPGRAWLPSSRYRPLAYRKGPWQVPS